MASCIFKLFAERDCFIAMEKVFSDYLIIPKANLSIIIDPKILSSIEYDKTEKYKNIQVDFVIINRKSYKAKCIIDLKDDLEKASSVKNDIITKSKISRYIIEKENGKENELAFIDILDKIRLSF